MADEQPPEGSIKHLKRIQPDERPMMLDYSSGRYGKRSNSGGGQFMLGFLFWVLTVVAVFACFGTFGPRAGQLMFYSIIATAACLVIGVCVWVHIKLRWRSFIPGMLVGFALTCLVPIGIVAVVCRK